MKLPYHLQTSTLRKAATPQHAEVMWLNAFRALMSLTNEDTLEIGYVKELRVPGPRARRDMTEAIARHQADLVYGYLSK